MRAKEFVEIVRQELVPCANRVEAKAMAKYMKNKFSFLGIKKPICVEKTKLVFNEVKSDLTSDLIIEIMKLFWKLEHREYQYVGLNLQKKYKKFLDKSAFKKLEYFVVNKSWWDTVDGLSVHAYGALILKYPELKSEMENLLTSENLWLRRVSIIHQLGFKNATDIEFLERACKTCMHESDFFIRKAIGWALRDYSRTNPDFVINFVQQNDKFLSGLSKREATRLINN
ncbi:MAG: DNA alkylation repair protein [Bacteroidia bacterium]